MKLLKKSLALLCALCLAFSLVSTAALAAKPGTTNPGHVKLDTALEDGASLFLLIKDTRLEGLTSFTALTALGLSDAAKAEVNWGAAVAALRTEKHNATKYNVVEGDSKDILNASVCGAIIVYKDGSCRMIPLVDDKKKDGLFLGNEGGGALNMWLNGWANSPIIPEPEDPENPEEPVSDPVLTIHYVYAAGGTAAPDYQKSISAGTGYSVASPGITGYYADTALVAGTMPDRNIEFTVTYYQQAFSVEHYFEQPDGSYVQAAAQATDGGVILPGESKQAADFVRTETNYTYFAGHADAINSIACTEDTYGQPLVLKLYYRLDTYTLTIHYVYENGDTAAPDYLKTLPVGADYSVDSPEITDYFTNVLQVAGTMPAENVEYTVVYRPLEDIPDDEPPLSPPSDDEPSDDIPLEDIPDEDVPLTGDARGVSAALAGLALSSGALLLLVRRKRK